MCMLKLDDLFIVYGDHQYAELAVFLDLLQSLRLLHQQHHWQATGISAYGDHLLFERLYSCLAEEIDNVGEKVVGAGNAELVETHYSLMNITRFLNALEDSMGISQNETPSTKLVRKSLLAEKSFVTAGEKIMRLLEKKEQLTRGIENMMGTILDTHEKNIYLLEQRLKNN